MSKDKKTNWYKTWWGITGAIIVLFVILLFAVDGSGSSSVNSSQLQQTQIPAQQASGQPSSIPSSSTTPSVNQQASPTQNISSNQQSYTPPASTKSSKCQENNGLPDSACTPGAINPKVTQSNIKSTICVSGYTTTIRPPTSYTTPLKIQQIQEYGYSDTSTKSYEEDHLIPLEVGGSPTDPANLWPEPYNINYGAKVKDKVENYLHAQVCSGAITLAEAQKEDATNWENVYTSHFGELNTASSSDFDDEVISNSAGSSTPTPSQTASDPQVKKSSTGICHEKGVSQYYNQTKTFTPYNSIADCLASGGRLPK